MYYKKKVLSYGIIIFRNPFFILDIYKKYLQYRVKYIFHIIINEYNENSSRTIKFVELLL